MKYLKIKGSNEKIEIKKFFCLGSNYPQHIAEMTAKKPSEPVIFLKPATAAIADNEQIVIPKISKLAHHEVELAVVISKQGKNIKKEQAFDYVRGYAVALDITLRDVQTKAKQQGRPWTIAKGFDTAAPISEVIPKEQIADPHDLTLKLSVNGEVKQHGNTKDMIFKINEIIEYLSAFFTLEYGDVIMTGTPAGVGAIKSGDKIEAEISDWAKICCTVA